MLNVLIALWCNILILGFTGCVYSQSSKQQHPGKIYQETCRKKKMTKVIKRLDEAV